MYHPTELCKSVMSWSTSYCLPLDSELTVGFKKEGLGSERGLRTVLIICSSSSEPHGPRLNSLQETEKPGIHRDLIKDLKVYRYQDFIFETEEICVRFRIYIL